MFDDTKYVNSGPGMPRSASGHAIGSSVSHNSAGTTMQLSSVRLLWFGILYDSLMLGILCIDGLYAKAIHHFSNDINPGVPSIFGWLDGLVWWGHSFPKLPANSSASEFYNSPTQNVSIPNSRKSLVSLVFCPNLGSFDSQLSLRGCKMRSISIPCGVIFRDVPASPGFEHVIHVQQRADFFNQSIPLEKVWFWVPLPCKTPCLKLWMWYNFNLQQPPKRYQTVVPVPG